MNTQNVFDDEYTSSTFVRDVDGVFSPNQDTFAVAGQERTIIGSIRYLC